MHIAEQKQKLRLDMTDRIKRMTNTERQAESRTLCKMLLKHIPEDAVVCAYFPLKTEPNMEHLLQELIQRKNRIFLPRFENEKMTYRELIDPADLKPGPFQIPEPPETAPELQPDEADIVLVPGRAFTKEGHRLGRGNGGFDIWIDTYRKVSMKTTYWGVCFECQLIRELPLEPHDQTLDAIVTAREFIKVED